MKYYKQTINGKDSYIALFEDNKILYDESFKVEVDEEGNEYSIPEYTLKPGIIEITEEEFSNHPQPQHKHK